jgi:hypothetical protein
METIGSQRISAYFDSETEVRIASNSKIRAGDGHRVTSYFDLARKVAELQFLNRDYVLLFRGQRTDHKTSKGNTSLRPPLLRGRGTAIPSKTTLVQRFERLREAESALLKCYRKERFKGIERLSRERILRWSILQHYEVCKTPLLDVTHSLRIAASFAAQNASTRAFILVLGVPAISGAVTASAEAGLQIVRLSSACPPAALRPHLQEGYLLGEYPEMADIEQKANYKLWETDFGLRLVSKFTFNPENFFSTTFPQLSDKAIYPAGHRDRMQEVTERVKSMINTPES